MQLILDAVVDYLPAPTEVDPQPLMDENGEETGEHAIVSTEETFKALAFKIMDDRFGALTFVRIYSGKLNKGDTILNSFTGKTEDTRGNRRKDSEIEPDRNRREVLLQDPMLLFRVLRQI